MDRITQYLEQDHQRLHSLLDGGDCAGFREVPVSPCYGGPGAHRTAASALASAERIAAARRSRP